MDKKHAALGRLALLGATLIWGSSFVILKTTLDTVPVLWLLAPRFTGAAIVMALIGLRQLRSIDRQCLKYGVGLGITLYLAYVFQTFGLQYTTPGKNAFLTATYCVIVPFLRWLLYKNRPEWRNIAAALICIVGMGLVSLTGGFTVGAGDALTMCCGLFYALQIIIVARAVEKYSIISLSALEFGVAAVLCWITAPFSAPFPTAVPTSAWLSVAYLCLMCTCACFALQAYGQRYTPPEPTAIILTLESVFGAALSVIYYGEVLSARVLAGFALIFVSVLISEVQLPLPRRAARSGVEQD